ncbi:sigma-70 family RNA polymerase sigma factor [Streptomyces sp. NPDC057253]|uniref:sigma-70 family RNA polymerase sigma factor n=1 Tax=Streptomyces sp. NPDC057253 TaxID=3346069 RepID=UPI00363F8F3C
MDTHVSETRKSRETAGTSAIALDDATWLFVQARPALLTLARQIVGNAHEAEDVLQEAWLRWQGADRRAVSNPSALLRKTTVRLAINVVQSAWKRRESCVGPSFPERMDDEANPEAVAARQDAVERAVLLLMETLTARQRAAYVLREGFGYPYDRIAEILHLSVVNTRQQVARAQRRLTGDLNGDHRGQPVDSVAHRRLVQAFFSAAQTGDLGHLERVLSTAANGSGSR